MQQISRSGLFMLRVLGVIGGIAMIMVGLSACQSGNAGKMLLSRVASPWIQDNPPKRSRYHSVREKR